MFFSLLYMIWCCCCDLTVFDGFYEYPGIINLSLYNWNPHGEDKFVRDEETSSYGVRLKSPLLTKGTRKLVRDVWVLEARVKETQLYRLHGRLIFVYWIFFGKCKIRDFHLKIIFYWFFKHGFHLALTRRCSFNVER